MNVWFGIGNSTKDVVVRETKTGGKVANFTVAVNRNYKDKETGEFKSDTTFVDCEAWGYAAEKAGKATKGSQLAVKGELKPDNWTGEDGKKHFGLKVRVDSLQLLKVKNGSDGEVVDSDNEPAVSDTPETTQGVTEEDIPF